VLPQDFPEISEVVKISDNINNVLVRYEAKGEEKRFEENFIMAADSNFFNVFSIPILKGDPGKALLNNTDLVLTESTSKRYFAKEEPVGKTLNLLGRDFTVTAVCADVPENSHFKFDFLARWDENVFGGGRRINFTSFSAHVYVVVKPGTDPKVLEEKFPEMVDTYAAAQIEQDLGKSWADYKKEGNGYRYFLQPLTGIHLDPTNIEAKMRPGGNKNYVYFLISVAILILVIACINFMNLATARSSERAREVGVRKTMGSAKSQLVLQFLTESILLSIFSTLLAIVIIYFALPSFNNLAGKQLEFTITINRIAALGIIALSVGCLAGSYPAFVLSAFNPVTVMKGNFSGSTKSAWLRNGLVVFQFFISIVLIIGTLVVSDQMKYMQNKSLGYDKDRILVIERAFALGNNRESFLEETKRIPNVINASTAQQLLGEERNFFGAQWKAQGSSEILTTKSMVIDDHFASTIGFNFVEGKGYSKETNDSLYVILNESAVKTLELTDPIGKKLSQVQRTPNGNVTVEYTIIGVIKDFNFQSLRDAITPLTIQSSESFGGGGAYAYLKLSGDHFASTVALVEAHWKKILPEEPFKYLFFDQNLMAQYENEKRAGQIFGVFSGLAIIIACVGLFGLAAYTASLRTKEIGVRKVLGATVGSVVLLLSMEFTKLILFAFILAVPFAWYIMDNWLQGFAYRTELGPGVFLLAGITALFISWITVSYQSIKAAIVNPVKSLRSE
jgi:putative ABC transport system permease protein